MKKEFDTLSLVDFILFMLRTSTESNKNIVKNILSQNTSLTWDEQQRICGQKMEHNDIISEHIWLDHNKNISWKNLCKNLHQFKYPSSDIMRRISSLSCITYDIIKKYPTGPPGCEWNWDYHAFSFNVNVNTDFIINNNDNCKLNWFELSRSKCVTMDFINKHLDYPWKWNYVTLNSNITIKFVKMHIDKISNFTNLSYNPSITWDDINENKDIPWNWNYIIINPNVTLDIALKSCSKNTIYQYIHNPNFGWNEVDHHTNIRWNLVPLYSSEKTSWEDINAHMPANDNISYCEAIASNPNLTPLIAYNLIQRGYKLSLTVLAANPMNQPYYLNDKYVKSKTKEMHQKIYDELMSVACNPNRCLSSWMAIDDVRDLERRWEN